METNVPMHHRTMIKDLYYESHDLKRSRKAGAVTFDSGKSSFQQAQPWLKLLGRKICLKEGWNHVIILNTACS